MLAMNDDNGQVDWGPARREHEIEPGRMRRIVITLLACPHHGSCNDCQHYHEECALIIITNPSSRAVPACSSVLTDQYATTATTKGSQWSSRLGIESQWFSFDDDDVANHCARCCCCFPIGLVCALPAASARQGCWPVAWWLTDWLTDWNSSQANRFAGARSVVLFCCSTYRALAAWDRRFLF